jgi:hypothetical protein
MRRAHRESPIRKGVLLLLVVAALVGGGGLGVWRLTWMAPVWWSPPDPGNERTEALAERVEYRVAELAHRVRPDPQEPWWVEIKQDQVNAWLSARLPQWLAHTHGRQWPPQAGPPQVNVESGAIRVGVDVETEAGRRYVVARVVPQIIEGELSLSLDGLAVGRVAIPGASADAIVERLKTSAPPGILDDPTLRAAIEVLSGRQRIDPVLKLHDGRRVRLLDVECRSQKLLLHCQTAR